LENITLQRASEYTQVIMLFGFFYILAFFSPFIGVFMINKKFLKRSTLFLLWTGIGSVTSMLLSFNFSGWNLNYMMISFSFLGISLGLGFPSCLSYFADLNTIENRGRNAGLIFLIVGPTILILGVIDQLLPTFVSFVFLAMWRFSCFVTLVTFKIKEVSIGTVIPSYKQIIVERKFTTYFIPWTMFCIVNYFEASLLKNFFGPEFSLLIPLIELGVAGVIASIGGYLSDFVGRKRVVIFGFAMLGIGYAFLGLFPYSVTSWYSYITADGIAWGIFAVMFFFLLWGELAGNQQKEKYYLLGELPFLIVSYIAMVVKPYLTAIHVSSAFSLASLFLFLAVIPLLFAPETLPERELKERELRNYIEKAKRIREKFTKG
jgi:MFS family permease